MGDERKFLHDAAGLLALGTLLLEDFMESDMNNDGDNNLKKAFNVLGTLNHLIQERREAVIANERNANQNRPHRR